MRVRSLLTATALCAVALSVPAPAQAAARVTVSNDQGAAKADPTYATTLEVKGSGFQSIKGGHGGVYVFFGTVSGTWQPSRGGQVGTNYRYVPDSESKNNQGFQRFVAFPGSDTAGAANGGTIAADGRWSTSLTVPGATFKTVDRSGKAVEVDCLKVTCGVITIGAHGVKNARNETFTPVAFGSLGASREPAASATDAPAAGAAAPSADAPTSAAAQPTTAKAADARTVVDPSTAVVGRVLSFTGSGFTPGEQVVATLDDGMAAVGPLSAGPSGEIAGVLQLPEGTTTGTHVLKLTGAASGATPTVNFPIAADPAPASASATTDDGGLPGWVPLAFVGLAAVALLGAVAFAAIRIRRMRRPAHAI
ncbi:MULTISPECIES: hypothetical protein [Aeromicrobium]|uniref:hypothetical protein n=1 Tax=Aeromicrobium TaxID=2040 RepID=UPI0006F79EE9|nr:MULTISPECIES: hypothetical protein [Aeromicrobium]KQX74967.1 hypothetical protein ASD10_07085 [Aeromicrobium sp. Root472D3]MCL8251160.1 hypothetical protein [Aeromicrobium fastidiosum]